jgi:hypothetical protein
MQSIQLEQHMARHDEPGSATSRSIRRERVVARHVRVNNVDLFPSHKLVQVACTLNVERIPQWQYQDLLG